MLYMASTSSSTGQLTLTVYFSLDTDPDIAQVQVQNRVNLAMPQLPSAVTQQGVSVQKKSSSIMMLIARVREGRPLQRRLRRQLRERLRARRAEARARRGPGADHGRARPGDAHLDESGPHGVARRSRRRDIANAVSQQNQLFGAGQIGQQPNAGAGRADVSRSSRRASTPSRASTRTSSCARARTAARSCALGDVARAEIGLQQYIVDSQAQRHAGDVHRRLPAAGRQRPHRVEGRARDARRR